MNQWQDTQLFCDYCFRYCRIFNINIALRELIIVAVVVAVVIVCMAGVFQVKSDIQPTAKKLLAKIQSIFRK